MATTQQLNLEQVIDLVDKQLLTPKEKEEIKKWVRDSKSIDVLVTGKTGAGKSSLLNYLLGSKIFKESESRSKPCTCTVESKEVEKNGIKIRAWDSPGLQDGTGGEEYLEDLRQKCKSVDLMLYCISMEEVRADLHVHESAIRKIDKLKCWKNTVFVLTFGNAMVHILKAQDQEATLESRFKARIAEWREAIQEVLKELNVDRKIIDNIQVFPAGHPTEAHLPGYRYWLSYAWSQGLLSMKKSAQAAMIKMETSGGFIPEERASDQFANVEADERMIVYTPGVRTAIGLAAGGIVAGGAAIGAVIGGTIGALAIGIPSFGVAAGAGLGIGAVVGGAVGGGIAIGVGALIALYRRHKMRRKD